MSTVQTNEMSETRETRRQRRAAAPDLRREERPTPHEAMLARRRRTTIVAAILSTLLTLALLLLVLLPGIGTANGSRTADGKTPVAIGDPSTAHVTPAAGWEVTGAGSDQLLLVSPDRGLTVRISPASAGKPADVLGAELAGAAGATGKIRTETLASKLTVAHVDAATEISAAVGDDRRAVLLGAEVSGSEAKKAKRDLSAYRPALAALVESIRLG